MDKHTPGPWTLSIEEHQPATDWFAAEVSVGSPWDGSHRSLASIPQAAPHWDSAAQARTIADVRLMAAAPDLLAVVERLYAVVIGHTGEVEDCDMCQLQGIAQAAIAKARGEASRG